MRVNEQAVKNILKSVGNAKLVAATKYVGIEEINELEKLGVKYFGENRVQAFLEKYEKSGVIIKRFPKDKDFTENIIYEKLLNDKLATNFRLSL